MRKFTVVLLILILLAGCQGDKETQTSTPRGTEAIALLSVTADIATLTPIADDGARNLRVGEIAEVHEGDQIVTSAQGEATLTYYTGAETLLMPGTTLIVENFERIGESSTHISVNVVVGQTITNIGTALDANSTHEVHTPVATIAVRGTNFAVFARPDNLTQVATLDGTVQVTAQDEQSAEIPCGYGVAIAPEGTLGEVKVWGMAQIDLTLPPGDIVPPAVIFEKTDTGQRFYYHAEDLMAVPIGTYNLMVEAAIPVRLENIEFPATLTAEDVTTIPVELSAIVIDAPDVMGNLLVHLEQNGQTADVVTGPGAPMLMQSGTWNLTVAPENQPNRTQRFEVTVVEGESETVQFSLGN
jgi:hypothetical protein